MNTLLRFSHHEGIHCLPRPLVFRLFSYGAGALRLLRAAGESGLSGNHVPITTVWLEKVIRQSYRMTCFLRFRHLARAKRVLSGNYGVLRRSGGVRGRCIEACPRSTTARCDAVLTAPNKTAAVRTRDVAIGSVAQGRARGARHRTPVWRLERSVLHIWLRSGRTLRRPHSRF